MYTASGKANDAGRAQTRSDATDRPAN